MQSRPRPRCKSCSSTNSETSTNVTSGSCSVSNLFIVNNHIHANPFNYYYFFIIIWRIVHRLSCLRQFLFILPPTAMKLYEPFAISKKPLVGPIVLHKDAKTKLTPPQTLPILVYLVQRRMSHPVFQNTIVLNHRRFLEGNQGFSSRIVGKLHLVWHDPPPLVRKHVLPSLLPKDLYAIPPTAYKKLATQGSHFASSPPSLFSSSFTGPSLLQGNRHVISDHVRLTRFWLVYF